MDGEKVQVSTYDEGIDIDIGHLANAEDHEHGKWASLKKYPWAFAWCMFSVWTVLLVSFENQASGTVLGIPEFRKDFGDEFKGEYVINSGWQGAITGVPSAT